jgi:hypothetical protein
MKAITTVMFALMLTTLLVSGVFAQTSSSGGGAGSGTTSSPSGGSGSSTSAPSSSGGGSGSGGSASDMQQEPVRGGKNALVKITGYMGYNDPFSRRAWVTLAKLDREFGDDIKFVFRNFPHEFQDKGFDAAQAGECVLSESNEETFFEFSDDIMTLPEDQRVELRDLIATANIFGADIEECLDRSKFLPEVFDDKKDGEREGVQGTPTFFINGQKIAGAQPYSVFEKIIKEELGDTKPSENFVKLYIEPSIKRTEDGRERFQVTVKDVHGSKIPACDTDSQICAQIARSIYSYKLSFHSSQDLEGKFEEEAFDLAQGESKTTSLYVQADKKGKYVFEVTVRGSDSKAEARGLLIFVDGDKPKPEPASYFIGQGFALNEDNSRGQLVELKILKKDEEIEGKMQFGQRNFRIEGKSSEGEVEFSLYDVNGRNSIGQFEGEMERFDEFLLLDGEIDFEIFSSPNQKWELTAFSKRKGQLKDIKPTSEDQIIETSVEEVLTISEEEAEEAEILITPKEIRQKKFLRIFPTGKKILEVEVTDNSRTYKTTFDPFEEKQIGKYTVKVEGNLEDEENIEISVKQA